MSESASGEATGSSDAGDKDSSAECPTCGKSLDTERAMKIHHATAHNESLVTEERPCANCGDVYEYRPGRNEKYCSRECLTDSQRNREKSKCAYCGLVFESKPSYNQNYCSKTCYHNDHEAFAEGKDHPQYTENVVVKCENCGEEYEEIPSRQDRTRFCSYSCKGEYSTKNDHPFGETGKDHPAWRGGHPEIYHGPNWGEQRRDALERDGYSCVICGVSKDRLKSNPHVHHVVPFKKFDDYEQANRLDNLITLCPKHHSEWEGLYLKPDVRHGYE